MSLQNLRIDRSWTLFLDRDGVINRRIVGGYVQSWEDFVFLPGVTDALARFSQHFGRVVVVSNQQGVGKGLMTEEQVIQLHRRMIEEIQTTGGRIDAVFFSPHLARAGSPMRKPGIGMGLKARRQFPEIQFRKSVMAGDSVSDMLFGKRLGMVTAFISDDAGPARLHPRLIDLRFADLPGLASYLELT